jgi:hypothetical protein
MPTQYQVLMSTSSGATYVYGNYESIEQALDAAEGLLRQGFGIKINQFRSISDQMDDPMAD